MRRWIFGLLGFLLVAGSVGTGPGAAAFSGGEPPAAADVLKSAELIVIARGGEQLGTVDLPVGAIITLYRLHVESYIRPARPGPETLVVAAIGGRGLYRAMDGPQISDTRSLYFLKRNGDTYSLAMGRITPRMPLEANSFPPGIWASHQEAFRPLLEQPRFQPYAMPAVRLNGRQIGTAWLIDGRSYLPATQLAAALGAEVAAEPVGPEGLVPLRAVAESLGIAVWWDAANWAVEMRMTTEPPEPVFISEGAAVGALAALVNAFIAESKTGSGSFDSYYYVPQARLNPTWVDPRTGGVRPVWELTVAPKGAPPETGITSLVDAVTGEVALHIWP
ncbi:MAG: hypothetical protein ACOY94_20800 [Bacillota bacterium]